MNFFIYICVSVFGGEGGEWSIIQLKKRDRVTNLPVNILVNLYQCIIITNLYNYKFQPFVIRFTY